MRKLERLLLTCLLFCSLNLAAQNRAVTGRVTNQGQPVAGVTVTIKGTKTSTETDASGNFSIQASNTDVLQFSSVGFRQKDVRVGESAFMNVELDIVPKELEEVVTTGYNIKRDKKSLGYAAPVVAGADIAQTRRENFINSLAGRVPGATVTLLVQDTLSKPDSSFAKYKFINLIPDLPSADLYIGTTKVASAVPYKGISPTFTVNTNSSSTTWGIRAAGGTTNLQTYASASSISNQRVYTVVARGYNAITATSDPRRRLISLIFNQ